MYTVQGSLVTVQYHYALHKIKVNRVWYDEISHTCPPHTHTHA